MNFELGYQTTTSFDIQMEINNILDANYYEHLSRSVHSTNNPIYAPGRSLLLDATFAF